MELNFCNDNVFLREEISSTFANNLFKDYSKEKVIELYEYLKENSRLDNISSKYLLDERFLNFTNIGIDLPTWFNFYLNTPEEKRIMIVGMEPRREEPNLGQIELSTPFALHLPYEKLKSSWKTVANFISCLIKNDYGVYLTDISKLFGKNSSGKKEVGDKKANEIIFGRELALIKPKYMLVLGKSALYRVQEFYKGRLPENVFPLVHPAAYGGEKNYFNILRNEKKII